MNRPLNVLTMALCFFALLGSKDILAADLKQHLIAAIDAPNGRSGGDLSGPMADLQPREGSSQNVVEIC